MKTKRKSKPEKEESRSTKQIKRKIARKMRIKKQKT